MNLKTPTQEQFQIVIDTLIEANKLFKKSPVCMYETEINHCGSPMCHGGWYAIIRGGCNFTRGAYQMAEDLGFRPEYKLRDWAEANPEIWGKNYAKN
jgi:hypothetical protein